LCDNFQEKEDEAKEKIVMEEAELKTRDE